MLIREKKSPILYPAKEIMQYKEIAQNRKIILFYRIIFGVQISLLFIYYFYYF